MWWLAEGVDEGKVAVVAGKRKSTGAEGFLPTQQLTCLLWLQGAESDIYELSHNCSITGLQQPVNIKRHTSTYLTTSAASGWLSTIRKPCLSRNLNQVRVGGGMFSRH